MTMRRGLRMAAACTFGFGVASGFEQATCATLDYPPKGMSPGVKKLPAWIQAGCGDKEYYCPEKNATFPADFCPDVMPDFSKHANFMAEELRKSPDTYQKYKDTVTKNGVTLAKCIKTGVDNPGHPMIKTCGIVAGDEESFTVFADLFEPIISARHGGYPRNAKHPTDMNIDNVLDTKIDPTGKYVLTSRVRTGRSVRGIRLPPSIGFDERRELERVCVKGLLNLKGDLKGDYYPLHGSMSYAPKMGGMSEKKEEELRSAGNLFQEPDSTLLLSSGMGRHWPDARGIYHNEAKNFFVWVGEEDHLRIVSMQKGDDIKGVFRRFATACNEVQKVLKSEGYDFMHSDHLGYILTCPSNLGTGLRAGQMLNLPLMSQRKDFKTICKKMGLQARGTAGVDSASVGGKWDISNADRLGKSETQLVNIMINGNAKLVKWEQMLEQGKTKAVEDEIGKL
eukprot:TRINITY_DN2366_c2_g2_i3.p1 TRINITY_DN2366_c2_g2~~TRINITY_DN2366_c2_g2_i3.p1  ORF type:complete len:452 (+),score=141.88 TRINITY_DN2366_c2_g2_i3:162-1517(+)